KTRLARHDRRLGKRILEVFDDGRGFGDREGVVDERRNTSGDRGIEIVERARLTLHRVEVAYLELEALLHERHEAGEDVGADPEGLDVEEDHGARLTLPRTTGSKTTTTSADARPLARRSWA